MGILEKIAEIEREIARTQKNKGEITQYAWWLNLILFRQLLSLHTFTNT